MREKTLLQKARKVLSDTWGSDVHLSVLEQNNEHQHVLRLAVQGVTPDEPQTLVLKRWRWEDEERFSAEFSASHFFNDWAGLEFIATVLGNESLVPQVYGGDKHAGFVLIEDLSGRKPLQDALWGQNPSKATEVLIRYGKLLGLLHGTTFGHLDTYSKIRDQLGADHPPQAQNYLLGMQRAAEALTKIDVDVPQSAQDDIRNAAGILSQPGKFLTYTHGDPVFSNIIDWQGSWWLIDFEAARFRHALLEGIYPRMFFPTSGLKYVLRIPEETWRQTEAAYRQTLSQYCDAARDDADYGTALTAACAFWALEFCQRWLEKALVGDAPAVMLKRIRQCIVTHTETFVVTSREFQTMVRLGAVFEALGTKLGARWIEEDCDLPFYPAFR